MLETKLAWCRRMYGLSQNQLARKAGVPATVIRAYEQRQRRIDGASAEVVWRLATALEMPMEALLEHDAEE